MAFKKVYVARGLDGKKNLLTNEDREIALEQVEKTLRIKNHPEENISQIIQHDREHFSAFPEFDLSSGKRLELLLMEDQSTGEAHTEISPNRKWSRRTIRESIKAVSDPSEGDIEYNAFGRFRKR